MTTNKRALLVFGVLIAVSSAVGCELVVDFDRTKIPTENSDAGLGSDAFITPTTDGSVTDGSAADTGASSDASDASDAGDAAD